MDKKTIAVDNINKFGTGVVSSDTWYNFPKGSDKKFTGVKRGDKLELELDDNGKVTVFKVVGSSAPQAKSGGYSAEDKAVMNRGAAAKAAFGATFQALMAEKGKGRQEALAETMEIVDAVAAYIANGLSNE